MPKATPATPLSPMSAFSKVQKELNTTGLQSNQAAAVGVDPNAKPTRGGAPFKQRVV